MSSSNNPNRPGPFDGQFESLEERIVFSANPLIEPPSAHTESETVAFPQSSGTGQATGDSSSDYARNQYGLDGTGQTVVIIDSGIAYDHYALGGGLGNDYRVVGGWDFAEDDADPYDDGAAGYHGTHVAGIVGSSDDTYTGVSSGVDLVALRVFDDQGNGSFDWIESALSWVHTHQDAFANPITTVNMSVGADWNAGDIPDWDTLEDELQLLQDDGIFVSVSAGNTFASHQTVGLNYPAASSYVVPVASVGSTGELSSFSQRNERVLAAPGEDITSTAPDYLYSFDGVTDDFISVSGTSMAAPYVAGASALLRQAMEAMGQSNIDQDDILSILRSTADEVFDPITNSTYDRINLVNALDSIVPDDDFGSSPDHAEQITTAENDHSIHGVVNSNSDVDHFNYVANESGELTIDMLWHSGEHNEAQLTVDGRTVSEPTTIDVVAGQEYSFAVEASGGIGTYTASLSLSTTSVSVPNSAAAGDATTESRISWHASEGGSYQIDIQLSDVGATSKLEIRDSGGNLLARIAQPGSSERLTVAVETGTELTIDVIGRGSLTDFTATRLGASNSGPGMGTASSSITVAASFRFDTGTTAAVEDVLIEAGPIEDASPLDLDAAMLGWEQCSEWMDEIASEDSEAPDFVADALNGSDAGHEGGSLEIFAVRLDEALLDTGCWRR